jgi:hypothetical protein
LYPDGIRHILTIFEKKNQDFSRKTFQRIPKNPNPSTQFYTYPAKQGHVKFQLSSLYRDGLRHIFDENSRIFQENYLENSKKFQI